MPTEPTTTKTPALNHPKKVEKIDVDEKSKPKKADKVTKIIKSDEKSDDEKPEKDDEIKKTNEDSDDEREEKDEKAMKDLWKDEKVSKNKK